MGYLSGRKNVGRLGFDRILPFVENRDANQEELGDYLQKRDDILENVSAIYYFIGDYKKLKEMPDDEFFNATKDAVLIWEK